MLIVPKRWMTQKVRNIQDLCPLGTLYHGSGIFCAYLGQRPDLEELVRVPKDGARC